MNFIEQARINSLIPAHTTSIDILEADSTPPGSATSFVGDMKPLIPMAGLIDKAAELVRLDKEIAKREQEIVEKERTRMADAENALGSLKDQGGRLLRCNDQSSLTPLIPIAGVRSAGRWIRY